MRFIIICPARLRLIDQIKIVRKLECAVPALHETLGTELLPLARLFARQCVGPVAGAVAKQHLAEVDPVEAEFRRLLSQRLRIHCADLHEARLVAAAREAAGIERAVRIHRLGIVVTRAPFAGKLRKEALHAGRHAFELFKILSNHVEVDAVLLRAVGGEHLEIGADEGRRIGLEPADGKTLQTCRTIFHRQEHPVLHFFEGKRHQHRRIFHQIPHPAIVLFLIEARRDARTASGDAEPRRHPDDGLHVGNRLRYLGRRAILESPLPKPRLLFGQKLRQADRRIHVGKRIVRVSVRDAVELRQKLKLEADALAARCLGIHRLVNLFPLRPLDVVAAKRPSCADHREEVPARAAFDPTMRIGIQKVPPEEEAVDLIVKAQRVVADVDGARHIEPFPNLLGKFAFAKALLGAELRRNAREKTALRARQLVLSRATVKDFAFESFDRLEVHSSAPPGELRRTVLSGIHAEGFVVVPVEGRKSGFDVRRSLSHVLFLGGAGD